MDLGEGKWGGCREEGKFWAHTGASKILQKRLPVEGNFALFCWRKVQVAECGVWGFSLYVRKKPLSLWLRLPQKPRSPWEDGGGKAGPGQGPALLDLALAALNQDKGKRSSKSPTDLKKKKSRKADGFWMKSVQLF